MAARARITDSTTVNSVAETPNNTEHGMNSTSSSNVFYAGVGDSEESDLEDLEDVSSSGESDNVR